MPKCPNCFFELVTSRYSHLRYKCAKCRKSYPKSEIDLAEFIVNKRRARKEEKKQAELEYKREYYKDNKEIVKTWQKKYDDENPEKVKEIRRHGHDKWAKNNQEHVKAYQKEYKKNNEVELKKYKKEYNKEYYKKNKDKRIKLSSD